MVSDTTLRSKRLQWVTIELIQTDGNLIRRK